MADKWTHLDNILVGEGLVGFVVLGVLEENLVHVGARILVQLVARTEDNQRDLAVAQHRQFIRLLHHAEFPLVKGHLSHIKAEGGVRISKVNLSGVSAAVEAALKGDIIGAADGKYLARLINSLALF